MIDCAMVIKKYKGDILSTHGNKVGEVQKENFCTKHHTEVKKGCVCRFKKSLEEIIGEEDE